MAIQIVTSSSSLAEVVDRVLDKGIYLEGWLRVSVIGIELITVEARVFITSIETYLKYAQAIGLSTHPAWVDAQSRQAETFSFFNKNS